MIGSRCPACEHDCNFVAGCGPEPADNLFIGEKPGQHEANKGRPFIGDAGAELDSTYVPRMGLERAEIRVTNAVKCRLGGNNNKPDPKQIKACSEWWLPGEISACEPKLIVLLGASACSLAELVGGGRIELDKDHGLPIRAKVLGWEGWVVPMYHPASGLHDSSQMILLLEDAERVGRWRRGKWKLPEPSGGGLEYREVEGEDDLLKVMADEHYPWLPVDTENDGPRAWSLQFSTRPGNGFLISAERTDLLELFWLLVLWGRQGLLLHNAVHDLPVSEALGANLKVLKWRDTMQMAYHLGNQPQGLKALGWRLLGRRMTGWDDLVEPWSRKKMQGWLVGKWLEASEKPERVEKQLKTKLKVSWKPGELERNLKRILSHSHKPDYDLWEQADKLADEKKLLGGTERDWPRVSIAHVPRAEAVRYACQDADVTGQVGAELERARENLMQEGGAWNIAEEEWDQ